MLVYRFLQSQIHRFGIIPTAAGTFFGQRELLFGKSLFRRYVLKIVILEQTLVGGIAIENEGMTEVNLKHLHRVYVKTRASEVNLTVEAICDGKSVVMSVCDTREFDGMKTVKVDFMSLEFEYLTLKIYSDCEIYAVFTDYTEGERAAC